MAFKEIQSIDDIAELRGAEKIVLVNSITDTGDALYPILKLKEEIILAGASDFMGEAVPTSPKPSKEGYWLVMQPGNYVNFGNKVLPNDSFGFIVYKGGTFTLTYKTINENFVKKQDVKSTLVASDPLPINAKSVLDKDYVQQSNVLSNLDVTKFYPVNSKAVYETINYLEDTMKNYINEQEFNKNFSYGVEWDATQADPKLTRIGNDIGHKTLPVHNLLRGCVINANGSINYYLDSKDWTKKENGQPSKLDGSDGDVMVEIPEIYFLAEKEGNKRRLMVLDRPFTGAKRFKKRYVSAYEATLERNTSTMRSVMNASDNYKGHTGAKGNLAPLSAVSRAAARSYARKRKGFEVMDITTYNILVWLYFIEYANRNSQLPVMEKSNGLTQGGIGAGLTTLNSQAWGDYNNSYGLPVIGKSNSLGNGSGEVKSGIVEFENDMICRYRGIENFFGNVVKLLDGIQLYRDVEGGIFSVFVTENTELFNDANHNGFGYIGEFPLTGGYVKDINFPFNVPATQGGGSSTTYYCDNCYAPSDYTGYTWYGVGGPCSSGAVAGVGYSSADYRVSYSNSRYGFRLCFITE